MVADLVAIGGRISKRRKQLGLTQEFVAEKMNVSVQMISNLERGNKAIKIDNLLKISDILGVSTDYILKGEINGTDAKRFDDSISKLSKNDYKMIELLINFCLDKTGD